MAGNRRLGHTCYLQGSCTTATEGVAGVVGRLAAEAVTHPATHVTNEGDVGERGCGSLVVQEVRHLYAAEA